MGRRASSRFGEWGWGGDDGSVLESQACPGFVALQICMHKIKQIVLEYSWHRLRWTSRVWHVAQGCVIACYYMSSPTYYETEQLDIIESLI